MTIEDVYNLTKKTMVNWEVEPTYSSGIVEAAYGYPSNTNFSVEIGVSKEELCPYRCIGAIVITRHNIDRVEVTNVSKQLNNEKEVINLLEDMISTSTDLKEFIKNKSDYFNY